MRWRADEEARASQRPYSIRTRIKTDNAILTEDQRRVRDHIPLEQGLRPAAVFQYASGPERSETIFH